MCKKNRNLRKERYKSDKQRLVRSLMARIYTETHSSGCVNFEKISAIIGEDMHDGVFAPGFSDYIRLGFSLIWIAFRPDRWHRHIILGPRVNLHTRIMT